VAGSARFFNALAVRSYGSTIFCPPLREHLLMAAPVVLIPSRRGWALKKAGMLRVLGILARTVGAGLFFPVEGRSHVLHRGRRLRGCRLLARRAAASCKLLLYLR